MRAYYLAPIGAAFVSILGVSACSSGGGGGATSTTFAKATHAAFPNVTYQGGPLLAKPNIVTVTFPGDTLAPELEAFGAAVTSTPWWDEARAGLCSSDGKSCVGQGTHGKAVRVGTAPASSYTDSAQGGASTLQTFLAGLIGDGTLPAPDDQTIYALYFAKSVSISLDGSASCTAFDGYHNATSVGSNAVYYAVIPECDPSEKASLLDYTTATAAHELIETASDPAAKPGFYLDTKDPASWGWDDIEGGEVADLCTDPFQLGQDLTKAGDFTVQRIWSPSRAANNLNPCVPVPDGEIYFNAAPSKPVVVVDVGQTASVEVTAFSEAPIADWTLAVEDWTDPNTTYFSATIDGSVSGANGPSIPVNNGKTLTVSITLAKDPSGAAGGEADASLVSKSASGAAHWWPFVVMTTAAAKSARVSGGKRIAHAHRGLSR